MFMGKDTLDSTVLTIFLGPVCLRTTKCSLEIPFQNFPISLWLYIQNSLRLAHLLRKYWWSPMLSFFSTHCRSSLRPKSVTCSTQRLVTTQLDDLRLPWHITAEQCKYNIPWKMIQTCSVIQLGSMISENLQHRYL